jgi:hypothetical protein
MKNRRKSISPDIWIALIAAAANIIAALVIRLH